MYYSNQLSVLSIPDHYTKASERRGRKTEGTDYDIEETMTMTQALQYCPGFEPDESEYDSDLDDPNPDPYLPVAESLKICVSDLTYLREICTKPTYRSSYVYQ